MVTVMPKVARRAETTLPPSLTATAPWHTHIGSFEGCQPDEEGGKVAQVSLPGREVRVRRGEIRWQNQQCQQSKLGGCCLEERETIRASLHYIYAAMLERFWSCPVCVCSGGWAMPAGKKQRRENRGDMLPPSQPGVRAVRPGKIVQSEYTQTSPSTIQPNITSLQITWRCFKPPERSHVPFSAVG